MNHHKTAVSVVEGDLRDAKRRVSAAKGPQKKGAVKKVEEEDDQDDDDENDMSVGESD